MAKISPLIEIKNYEKSGNCPCNEDTVTITENKILDASTENNNTVLEDRLNDCDMDKIVLPKGYSNSTKSTAKIAPLRNEPIQEDICI